MDQQPSSSSPETSTSAPKNASWSAIISIVVILAMIIIGAMYVWNQRIAEQKGLPKSTPTTSTSTQY